MPNFEFLEKVRCTGPEWGQWSSTKDEGFNGMFRWLHKGWMFRVVASDGEGWQHVSVSIEGANRCPTWEEMCMVKNLFWAENEWAVQFHPAKSEYVNTHPRCLHLWRPLNQSMPTPPAIMVGIK
jgi:hypothetical protein